LNIYSKLFLGWIIISLVLTWTPGNALIKPDFLDVSLMEFVVHFSMFMVFSFLLTGSINKDDNLNISKRILFVIVISNSLIFSFITEGGQFFIPGRYFSSLDIIMNFFGSLCGFGLFFLKLKYFSN
jgi:VanZ family protein